MKLHKALAALDALAQESRLAIFLLLLQQGGEEGLSVSVIGEKLHIPSATLSFHLSQLSQAGVVHAERKGRMIFYSANKKKIKKLVALLTKGPKYAPTASDPLKDLDLLSEDDDLIDR